MDSAQFDILIFYGWWQIAVCFFAFAGLMAIWYHIGRKQEDHGQIWLALSILCWSFSGVVEVYYASKGATGPGHDLFLNGWRSIFSLLNSLFILFALPWFRYLPKPLEPIIKSKYWPLIVGLPFVFSILPTISKMISGNEHSLISELDVYYATLTLIVLGLVLWQSFFKRNLATLAYLSIICILITFTAQVYKLNDSSFYQTLFSAIFKTTLIMIFFALALSWVKDLAEHLQVKKEHIFLRFERVKGDKRRFENAVFVKGLTGNEVKKITLSATHYNLFLKFATRRKVEPEGWLEIRPKSETRNSRTYDIKDHNEIKRLIGAILDGVFGKDLWSKDKHELPLRQTLFEMSKQRARKIRLSLPGENITLPSV